jgi:uncharacterized protein YegJ (DUF2314 family)
MKSTMQSGGVVLLVAAILNCGCSKPPNSQPTAGTNGPAQLPPTVDVGPNDSQMREAIQHARETFQDFWRQTDQGRIGTPLLKVGLGDAGTPGKGEFVWVAPLSFDGQTVTGTVTSAPVKIRSISAGQRVTFPLAQVGDWLYIKDGKLVGGFTVRLLRSRLSEQERRIHDSHYPFAFE